MPHVYRYVGPKELLEVVATTPRGAVISSADDLARFVREQREHTLTFVIATDGVLRVASRHSEHVACAGGEDVLSAGELEVEHARIERISNQSTGYCPEPESWSEVAAALGRAGIAHPPAFTDAIVFRLCPQCRERNIVKEGDFTCALCGCALPSVWNF